MAFQIYYCKGSERSDVKWIDSRSTPNGWRIAASTLVFNTEAEAMAHMEDQLRPGANWSHLPRPDFTWWVGPADWRVREQHKAKQGTYKLPIWAKERWWIDYASWHKDHYPHVSVEDPTMLAYTPSPEYGERDRQTRISPGKYLKKYFGSSEKTGLVKDGPGKGCHPVLTDQQIAYYAEWWEKGTRPRKYSAAELRFATTPDEIARVYRTGPRSCMSSEGISYDQAHHPTRVYGAGDLQIAYLFMKGRAKKEIMARALCWPDKKVFGRVYPADGNYASDGYQSEADLLEGRDELAQRLKDLGWTSIGERSNVFDGARLLRIPYKNSPGYYYMPYLDNSYNFVQKKDDKEFFFLQRTGGQTGSTSGYVEVMVTFDCDHCKRPKPERGAQDVFLCDVVDKPDQKPERWCSTCVGGSTWVDWEGVRYSVGVPNVYVARGSYTLSWATRNNFYQCALSGDWYDPATEGGTPVEVVGMNGKAAKEQIPYYAFYCTYDGKYYRQHDMSAQFCGFPKSMDADPSITPELREKYNGLKRTQTWNLAKRRWETEPGHVEQGRYLELFYYAHQDWKTAEKRRLQAEKSAVEAVKLPKKRSSRAKVTPVAFALDDAEPLWTTTTAATA